MNRVHLLALLATISVFCRAAIVPTTNSTLDTAVSFYDIPLNLTSLNATA
jgi:hypothetical protein